MRLIVHSNLQSRKYGKRWENVLNVRKWKFLEENKQTKKHLSLGQKPHLCLEYSKGCRMIRPEWLMNLWTFTFWLMNLRTFTMIGVFPPIMFKVCVCLMQKDWRITKSIEIIWWGISKKCLISLKKNFKLVFLSRCVYTENVLSCKHLQQINLSSNLLDSEGLMSNESITFEDPAFWLQTQYL